MCLEDGYVYFVDINGRKIVSFNSVSGASDSLEMPQQIGCIVPRKSGGFVAALEVCFPFFSCITRSLSMRFTLFIKSESHCACRL